MIVLLALLACKGEDAPSDQADDSLVNVDDSSADDSQGGSDDSTVDTYEPLEELVCGEVPALPEPSIEGRRMYADVTWSLDFDADAEAAGYADCTYSRTWEGDERLDQEYLCPECDHFFKGESVIYDGEDCAAILSSAGPVRTEQWGYNAAGTLFRTNLDNGPTNALTEFVVPLENEDAEVGWGSDYTVNDGGTMRLEAFGTVRWVSDPELMLVDPNAARTEPYAAGWPQDNPGTLVQDYDLAPGSVFPNVRLQDQCGDMVDLWDFYGRYIIIDASQYDCGPCQNMAQSEHAFLDSLRSDGIKVRVITFMGNGLSDSLSEPQPGIIDQWVEAFSITEPVLADRGFSYAMLASYLYEQTGEDYGYPSWLILTPEMTILSGNVGFGTWDTLEEIIRADAESR